MPYNTMSHVGLEADYFVTPQMLKDMSSTWHYGWEWSGPEPTRASLGGPNYVTCSCEHAACGLVARIDPACEFDDHRTKVGAPKQLHKAADCPAKESR